MISLWDMPLDGATIDTSGMYRYSLWRVWDESKPRVLFCMLNPSTADACTNDPTIRRCISFAKSWQCGSLEVVNLFAFRATHPDDLVQAVDPIGPENNASIQQALTRASLVVCAWGCHKFIGYRVLDVFQLLEGKEIYCLGTTKDGFPRHPLYVPAATKLERLP